MNIKTYTTLDKKVFNHWESLWKASAQANFINSPYWFRSVLETFGYTEFVIFAVYKQDEMVAVGGVIKEKRYGIDVYSLPPGDFVCGVPFIYDSKDLDVLRELTKVLNGLKNVVLDNVPSQPAQQLQNCSNTVTITTFSINLCLKFEKDDNGQVIIPKKKRMLREGKKVEDKFSFASYTGKDDQVLKLAFQIDKKSRKFSRGYNAFSNQDIQRFYQSLAKNFGQYLLLNFLYFDKKPIVYEMGFLIGDTYYGSQIAFDEAYREYAPGKVFEVKLIEHLANNGKQRIDYGSGDNFIKRTLANEQQTLYKVIISQSILVRKYLQCLYYWRDKLFTLITKNAQLYSLYRLIKKTVSHE